MLLKILIFTVVMSFNNLKKVMSIMLITFSCFFSYSQSVNKENENYTKLGIFVGAERLFTNNQQNSVGYFYDSQRTFSFGIDYRFYSLKKINFKTGLHFRTYLINNLYHIKSFDYGGEFDLIGLTQVGDINQYKLPLSAEYIITISKHFDLFVGTGVELLFYEDDPSSGGLLINNPNIENPIGFLETGNNKGQFTFGFNLAIGTNIYTKLFCFKPYLKYNIQNEDIFVNRVETVNLQVSTNTTSFHKINGNYLMFGLAIIPSKEMFSKKK